MLEFVFLLGALFWIRGFCCVVDFVLIALSLFWRCIFIGDDVELLLDLCLEDFVSCCSGRFELLWY